MANRYLNTPPAYWSAALVLGSSGPSPSLLAARCLLKWPPEGRGKRGGRGGGERGAETERLVGRPSWNKAARYEGEDGREADELAKRLVAQKTLTCNKEIKLILQHYIFYIYISLFDHLKRTSYIRFCHRTV